MQSITDSGMVCIWRTNFQVGLKTIDDINQTHAIKVYNLFLIIYQLYLELVYIKVQYMKLWLLKTYATLIYIYIYIYLHYSSRGSQLGRCAMRPSLYDLVSVRKCHGRTWLSNMSLQKWYIKFKMFVFASPLLCDKILTGFQNLEKNEFFNNVYRKLSVSIIIA